MQEEGGGGSEKPVISKTRHAASRPFLGKAKAKLSNPLIYLLTHSLHVSSCLLLPHQELEVELSDASIMADPVIGVF